MEYICINPRVLDTPEKIHDLLRQELAFDPGYGMNLDALYDQMTAHFSPCSVLCLRFVKDGAPVYPHADPIYRVLADAAKVNSALRIDLETLPAT